MNCACCGAGISGAHISRWGVPFCWSECVDKFELRAGDALDAEVDKTRVRYGLKPLSFYNDVPEAAQ